MSYQAQSDAILNNDDEKSSDIPCGEETSYTEESRSQPLCVVSKHSVPIPASLLIESLIKKICTIYESDPKKSSVMYKVMCDKLYNMNLLGESYTMNEFEGIRSQYQRAFIHLLASIKNGDVLPLSPMWPKAETHSHYHMEFDEVEYIAGGGFGQVVVSPSDGTEYAVKKIAIRSEGIKSVRNYLSEVKTFASMNHPNIVQYKGAWLQMGAPTVNKALKDMNSETKDSTSLSSTQSRKTQYTYRKDSYSFTEEKEDDHSDFQIDFEHSYTGIGSKAQVTPSKLRKKRKSLSEGETANALCKLDFKEIQKIRSVNKSKVKWATLYIQMALCHSTLKQWLERRNDVPEPEKAVVHVNEQVIRSTTINKILKQLLTGLEYIHSKGVVHHDIKPSNIFMQIENSDIIIQLGDFGLACPLQSARHSLALGTKLYAAPEQLAGECNYKSDMYSLGIVLYELVENFGTDMERVRRISDLRKGNLPPNLSTKYPDIARMISELVVTDPKKRPDTTTLLNTLKSTEIKHVEQLRMELAEKDEEIMHLRELLKSHGIKAL